MIRVAKTTALVMATLVGIWILWKFREPVRSFSALAGCGRRRPRPDRASGRPWPAQVLVLAAVYVAGGLVVGGLSLAAVYLVSDELPHAAKDFQRLYGYLANHALAVGWIKRLLGDHLPDADELLMTLVGRHGEQAIGLVVGTAFGLASAILEVLFVFVLSIYWALDREYFEQLWLSLLPLSQRVWRGDYGTCWKVNWGPTRGARSRRACLPAWCSALVSRCWEYAIRRCWPWSPQQAG